MLKKELSYFNLIAFVYWSKYYHAKNISGDSGMNSQYLKLEKYAERN